MTLPPFEMFLRDDRDPIGWEAISPTRGRLPNAVLADQLWKEYYDAVDVAEENNFNVKSCMEMSRLLTEIDRLEGSL